jgi:hypothetical protein
MKFDAIAKRVAALGHGGEELAPISFQWFKENGTPSGPLIKRMIPKNRFGWLTECPKDNAEA